MRGEGINEVIRINPKGSKKCVVTKNVCTKFHDSPTQCCEDISALTTAVEESDCGWLQTADTDSEVCGLSTVAVTLFLAETSRC